MENILITLELGEHTEYLLDKAEELTHLQGAKVWLLHVAAPDPEFVGYAAGPQYIRDFRADELKQEHKMLQEYAQRFKDRGVDSEGLVIPGATIEMIMKESEKLEADLIITGHQSHGFMYTMFFGSVSKNIVSQSKVPVMVVPFG